MAHNTLNGGAVTEIGGGKAMLGGAVYEVDSGKAMIGGTVYPISFGGAPCTVTINGKIGQQGGSATKITAVGVKVFGPGGNEKVNVWFDSQPNTVMDGWNVESSVTSISRVYDINAGDTILISAEAYGYPATTAAITVNGSTVFSGTTPDSKADFPMEHTMKVTGNIVVTASDTTTMLTVTMEG